MSAAGPGWVDWGRNFMKNTTEHLMRRGTQLMRRGTQLSQLSQLWTVSLVTIMIGLRRLRSSPSARIVRHPPRAACLPTVPANPGTTGAPACSNSMLSSSAATPLLIVDSVGKRGRAASVGKYQQVSASAAACCAPGPSSPRRRRSAGCARPQVRARRSATEPAPPPAARPPELCSSPATHSPHGRDTAC